MYAFVYLFVYVHLLLEKREWVAGLPPGLTYLEKGRGRVIGHNEGSEIMQRMGTRLKVAG